MAVCNVFNELNSASGNFLMFSQYADDITCNYSEGNNYRVVPSKFIALDIDYSKLNNDIVNPNNEDLNKAIPNYFQNYFENGCAVGRNDAYWTPEISKNLFWTSMFDGGFLTRGNESVINELMYHGEISMHSYNRHNGMGYGEIYCYIPINGYQKRSRVEQVSLKENREFVENVNDKLEGQNLINTYKDKIPFYYNQEYILSFDDNDFTDLKDNESINNYKINTVVVCYDIYEVQNNYDSVLIYKNIPMGIYFAGKFEGTKLSNEVTKFVNTTIGTGSSYGLRICTRFSVCSLQSTVFELDTDDYGSNMAQLMVMQNENLSMMLDVVKSANDTHQQYKDLLSIFKNNRTNVPYVKSINGEDFWFVNGKFVSKVGGNTTNSNSDCCQELTEEELQNYIDGNVPDFCRCSEITLDELEREFGDKTEDGLIKVGLADKNTINEYLKNK
jgi:hypothetical protein